MPVVGAELRPCFLQVSIAGVDVYESTTPSCHANGVIFRDGWDIWRLLSNWSSSEMFGRCAQTILPPWAGDRKKMIVLTENSLACWSWMYTSQITPLMSWLHLKRLVSRWFVHENCNCPSVLQPLNITVNSVVKSALGDYFTPWYSGRVYDALKQCPDDMEPSVLAVHLISICQSSSLACKLRNGCFLSS